MSKTVSAELCYEARIHYFHFLYCSIVPLSLTHTVKAWLLAAFFGAAISVQEIPIITLFHPVQAGKGVKD